MFFDEKKLQGHPCVLKVECNKLKLTYDFRVQLFKAWKEEQSQVVIHRILVENGLTDDIVGMDYIAILAKRFKECGFPTPYSSEISSRTGYLEENPLVLSGKYTKVLNEKGRGLAIDESFLQEIGNSYPYISIEEKLRMVGLDPLDVGYSRIRKIRIELEKKQELAYRSQLNDFLNQSDCNNEKKYEAETEIRAEVETGVGAYENTEKASLLELHPYVESVDDYGMVRMKKAFYNEACLLSPLGLEQIFNVFELPANEIPEKSKITINSKLRSWIKGKEQLTENSEQIERIQKTKIFELNRIVKEQFSVLGAGFTAMDTKSKRCFCQYLRDLPRDTTGYYTCAKIRELMGISKSTYYAALNNENYGAAEEQRNRNDENDIEVIREVLKYKGIEKGIRQVYMLMPKITGNNFSLHRIRRLMNKYGIRTTIRRPSKNRKAVKELIERNKKANLLMRRFRMYRPNEVRLTDVTYLDYGEGLRAYGSASVDPVTGRLICFVISENNDLHLALDTLKAMDEHPAKSGAILHSDQGMLYMTDEYQAAVIEKELNQSMSRRGNCWDNAPQESFFGHFKDECHYEECKTLEELRTTIRNYALYYNKERCLWDKERMTPEEYEKYLESMDESEWSSYLADREEQFKKGKKESAAKAVEDARQYRNKAQKKLEEIKNEAGKKRRKV